MVPSDGNSSRSGLTEAGTTAEDSDIAGTITIPEIAHDTDEDEFVVCV